MGEEYDFMEINSERRRHLLMSWRDQYIIAANQLLNSTAIEACETFEDQLNEASAWDSAWDPAGFADSRIDDLMAANLEKPFEELFKRAGEDLQLIEGQLADLGNIVANGPGAVFPNGSKEVDPAGQPEFLDVSQPASGPLKWLQSMRGIIPKPIKNMAAYTSDTTDWLVQDKIGLRNRLRHAALVRIDEAWMGDVGETVSVLTQAIAFIDTATDQARLVAS